MSSIQFKPVPGSEKGDTYRSRRILGSSTGATLIELGIALVSAELGSAIPGLCSRCQSGRNEQSSTAQYPNVFCSEQCEQTFIRTALASLTVEDCIRMHERLERLLTAGQAPGI